jgi:hypothetical protein
MSRATPSHSNAPDSWSHLSTATTMASAWSLAGGVAGGLLVASLLATGRMHPGGALALTALTAALGSVLGAVHGAILGYLGRSETAAPASRWQEVALGGMLAVSSLAVAVLLAIWLVLSVLLLRSGSSAGWLALGLAGPACLAILVWATALGWRTLEHAYARWPDHRIGTWLSLAGFLVLAALFMQVRPAIPGTGMQLTRIAAVVVAGTAVVWLVVPAIVLTMRLAHRYQRPQRPR